MRTYGTYRYHPAQLGRPAQWAIDARPDTAIRLKRHFPRTSQSRTGTMLIADTPDVARDLTWFMDRFPLVPADQASAEYLVKRTALHRAAEEAIDSLLAGHRPQYGWREPALPPRDYQAIVPHVVRASGGLLLGDDLALGKTFSSLLILCDPQALPAVAVTESHLIPQWEREIEKFLPWLDVHTITSTTPYPLGGNVEMAQDELPLGIKKKKRRGLDRVPDVLLTTYNKLDGWADHLAGMTRTIIFDEIQQLRTGPSTKKYIAAARIADGSTARIGATASPVYNYGFEAFNIIDVLQPGALGMAHEFRREWCTEGEKGKVREPEALGLHLREQGILLRRTRKDVGMEVGDEPIRIIQHVDTDPDVIKRMTSSVVDMAKLVWSSSADAVERWRAGGELDLRMRHATGVAKAPFVAEFARLVLESEERIVLWGWHHDVYDIWADRLKAYDPVCYTGDQTARGKDRNYRRFIGGDSRVLLMSLRSGTGLDGLQLACNVGIAGELDWSPEVLKQCIGRLDRPGQTKQVLAYLMLSDDGSDPPMAEVLEDKRQQAEPIMNPGMDLFALPSDAGMHRVKLLAAQVLRRAGIDLPAETGAHLVAS